MFSFLNFFHSKPDDTHKNRTDSGTINIRKLNLSSLQSKTHNNRLPIVFNPNRSNTTFGVKRCGDFNGNICHPQKKAKTRNNEILSSYSSSRFLLKPARKRSHQTDNEEDELPDRKHCKNCTCCEPSVLPENDQNILNKSEPTTSNDLSSDFVTVAAGRIFNRSGKTQVIKKMSMKTIIHEILDDDDLTPYTSIEKVEEKKKKYQNKVASLKQHADHHSANLTVSAPSIETGYLSVASLAASMPRTSKNISGRIPKINEENKSDRKSTSTNELTFQIPKTAVQISGEQRELAFQSTENDKSQTVGQSRSKNNSDKFSSEFSSPVSKSSECATNASTLSSFLTFEVPNPLAAANLSTSLMQIDTPISDNQQSLSKIKFDILETPVAQFGVFDVDGIKSTPVMEFGVSNSYNQQSIDSLQFETVKESENSISSSLFSFDNNVKSNEDIKSADPVNFQCGPPKSDSEFLTDCDDLGSQHFDQTVFNNYDTAIAESTPKLSFGTLPVPVFGISEGYLSKPFTNQSIDHQESKSVFSFGSSLALDQPLQCANGMEKPVEPFEFESTVSSGSAFQFNVNQAGNGSVKLENVSNMFPTPEFSGFGDSVPQQTITQDNVPSPQTSQFGNTDSLGAAAAFGIVTSHPSSTFGTNLSYHYESSNSDPNNSSTLALGTGYQFTNPDGTFDCNVPPMTALPFQLGPTSPVLSTSQLKGAQSLDLSVSSQPLFCSDLAPAGERRIVKAVRRRQPQ